MGKKIVPSKCVHHWLIEPASGGDSQGKCKKCKTLKKFSNSGWEDSRSGWKESVTTSSRLQGEKID